jgi:hypothetical protein
VLRNEPKEEEKEEEMETEVQPEEEEEKNSFYSSYKEAVQGEGREGVEDPLREVEFFVFGSWDLKLSFSRQGRNFLFLQGYFL